MELANNNMYRLKVEQKAHFTQQELVEWHERYGHILLSAFGKKDEVPEGIHKVSLQCDACSRGKMTEPTSLSDSAAPDIPVMCTTQVGQPVHVDVCRAIGPPLRNGEQYILSLIDDDSRISLAEALKDRKDASMILPQMIAGFETTFNCKIGEVRRDYGKELEKGTRDANKNVRATVPYHHETNTVAGREPQSHLHLHLHHLLLHQHQQ